MHTADDAAHERTLQPHLAPEAPRQPYAPLSDAAILDIALQVREAIHYPPPGDRSTWILSAAAALDSVDEDRVIAALDRLAAPESEPAT